MLLTSVDVLTKYWPFGRETLFLCRVAKAGPCFAVYYSSFAVVAIAVDRHRCIVHSDSKQVGTPVCWFTLLNSKHCKQTKPLDNICCSILLINLNKTLPVLAIHSYNNGTLDIILPGVAGE